ncbi:MAG: hypothetical protein HDT26_12770 [Subdoligranulum sp.]|nr:hypothetical protein [Subdoligranulum sp.]MBD5095118.1 hypothetical protein [Subdoligranulum sp.]
MEPEMTAGIPRMEHEEFAQRIKEENDRQNHRLAILEENTRRLEKMNVSIERLAVNMENMLKEQLQQGRRLEQLEARDGELWRKVLAHAITTAVGAVLAYLFLQVGM